MPQMEIKREKLECFSFVNCALCFGRRNLKDMFEVNESTSKYSTMIAKCFNIQIQRVCDDLKICKICIEELSEALEFKHKLDCFITSKQSTEKIYKDNCSSDYSNLKLAFVVKNEYLIDDDVGTKEISDCESDKNTKSNISIDFLSNSKTENRSDEIHHLIKSHSEISNSFIPNIEPSALICPVCKEEFNSHTLLLQHYPNHKPKYICDICGKVHLNKTSLKKHLPKHTLKRHPCNRCKNSYTSEYLLYKHVQQQHNGIGSFACRLCPKQFTSYSVKNKHQTEDHGIPARRYVCPSCGKPYSASWLLTAHIRRVHHKIYNFECTVCNKKFFSKRELDSHFILHTGEKNYECTMCNKKFSKKIDLDRHFIHHTGEKNFECTVCNKKFSRKEYLDKHFIIHSDKKKFECTLCNKKFFRKEYLDKHFIIHTGEKNFECTVCNKKFSRKVYLDKHFVIHTDEKNFDCTLCNKKFFRKWDLNIHIANHTGEKNFECDVCSKSYTRKDTLMKHIKIHTNTRAYKCEYCKKTFIQHCHLKTHLKCIHNRIITLKC